LLRLSAPVVRALELVKLEAVGIACSILQTSLFLMVDSSTSFVGLTNTVMGFLDKSTGLVHPTVSLQSSSKNLT
jgi:hypothetical protein